MVAHSDINPIGHPSLWCMRVFCRCQSIQHPPQRMGWNCAPSEPLFVRDGKVEWTKRRKAGGRRENLFARLQILMKAFLYDQNERTRARMHARAHNTHIRTQTHRCKDIRTQTHRCTDTQTQTHKQTNTQTHTHTQRERERETHTHTLSQRQLHTHTCMYIYIYICCRVNNLATISQLLVHLFCFFLFFCFFFKIVFFLQGEWEFWKKEALTKIPVKTVRSIAWPHFSNFFAKDVAKLLTLRWPSYWPYNFDQKTKIQHVKIIKKPIFIVFWATRKKQQNSPTKKQ